MPGRNLANTAVHRRFLEGRDPAIAAAEIQEDQCRITSAVVDGILAQG